MSLRQDIIDNHDGLQSRALYITSGDAEKARDLVQDGVCRMLDNEAKYTPGSDLLSWAFIIMRNLYISRNIKEEKIQKITLGGLVFTWDNLFPVEKVDFLGTGHKITTEDLEKMIARLSPAHRTVLKLKLDGYRTGDLPGILGVPLGTVKSRIHYAIEAMKNMFYGTEGTQ